MESHLALPLLSTVRVSEEVCLCVAATQVLRFHLVTSKAVLTFKPAFTHQIFRDEAIVGYEDPSIDIYLDAATLATHVRVSPLGPPPAAAASSTSSAGASAASSASASATASTTASTTASEAPVVEFTNMMQRLVDCDGLPQKEHIAARSEFDALVRQSTSSFAPLGTHVSRFASRAPAWAARGGDTTTTTSSSATAAPAWYELWRVQPSRCATADRLQLDRLQVMSLYFIDGSSFVDFERPGWTIYTLYCNGGGGGDGARCIAGFVTAHLFTQPFREERPTSLKICQVLVLPPFQRRGLASRIVSQIYADAARANHFEVTVEDPAPTFALLRDIVDLQLLEAHLSDERALELVALPASRARGRAPLIDAAQRLHILLRITRKQIVRCVEMAALRRLRSLLRTAAAAVDARASASVQVAEGEEDQAEVIELPPALIELQRVYRLTLKRGIFSTEEFTEECAEYTKEQRKELLVERYAAAIAHFELVCAAVEKRRPAAARSASGDGDEVAAAGGGGGAEAIASPLKKQRVSDAL